VEADGEVVGVGLRAGEALLGVDVALLRGGVAIAAVSSRRSAVSSRSPARSSRQRRPERAMRRLLPGSRRAPCCGDGCASDGACS
jgi:hypothetical protein